MSNIAQFSESDILDAVAIVSVTGKTSTDRRLSVITKATNATKLFASGLKGKLGNAARAGLQEQGTGMMFMSARNGNYRPLAEILALICAEPVSITNRSSFESLLDRYQPKLDALVMSDKVYGKNDKVTTNAANLMSCIALIKATYDAIEQLITEENDQAAA